MPPIRLSVIATNYNCAHALERHLESIYTRFDNEDFEYVLVDNRSDDGSPKILERWASAQGNFRWVSRRCSRGRGRQIAAGLARGARFLVVDTDTVYYPILRPFVERAASEHAAFAVQAIYAGLFPRELWEAVGGQRNFNVGEDLDMWLRIARLGRMRWYPTRMGENEKEAWASNAEDPFSARYRRSRRLQRLVRQEYDMLRLSRYEVDDLEAIWRSNAIDLGLGPLEATWFGNQAHIGLVARARALARGAWKVLRS